MNRVKKYAKIKHRPVGQAVKGLIRECPILEALYKRQYKDRVDLKTCKPIQHWFIEDLGMSDLICYCFEYTSDDIKQDFIVNGRSLIMEKIMAEKKMGACQCTIKNPSGK